MARGSRAKRGFTITELVVVIGIIAILAAVLIPTFANIIQRSRESADTQNVEHMNTALYAYEVSNEKPSTMTDVVEVLADSGYLLENLSPTGDGYDIVWDQEHNRLALIDEDGETIYSDGDVRETASMLWTIVDEIPTGEEDKGYSYYLSTGYVGADAVTVTAGVDVGENEGIAVTYATQEAKNVTVRTNGGALTVNAPASNVNHYGTASEVTITAVAQNSYHLYGRVESDITVTSGRVVLESGSSSNTVYVNGGGVQLEWSNNAKPEAVGVSSSVNLNEVSIPEDDEVEVTGSINETYRGLFAGGLGTESSPYLIATAEQFKNISTLYAAKTAEGVEYSGGSYYFLQTADIELPESNYYIPFFTGVYDGGDHQLSFAASVTSDSFFYFFGTIFDSTTFRNMNIMLRSDQPFSMVYSTDWVCDTSDILYENVTIDSNGATVLANTSNFGFFGCYLINNFTSARFVDCVNNAHLNNGGTSTGVFLGSGWIFYDNLDAKVEYVNCVNNGDISGAAQVGLLYGNGAYTGVYSGSDDSKIETDYSTDLISVENVRNNGVIMSLASSGGVAAVAPRSETLNSAYQDACGGSYISSSYFSGKNVYVAQDGVQYSTNVDGASDGITFKIAFNVNVLDNGDGTVSNTTKYFYDLTTGADVSETNVLTHRAYDLQKATDVFGDDIVNGLSFDENGIAKYVDDGVMYLIFRDKQIGRNPESVTPGETGIVVYLYAYNAGGSCVGVLPVK